MDKYIVYVDDNYHSGDENERYKLGEFETREEALTTCKKIVDSFFEQLIKGEHSFNELWEGYMMFGEDPFIFNDDAGSRFSAWEYARLKCAEFAK